MSIKKIDTLTKEQEAQIDVYYKKYLELGRNTNPTNEDETRKLIHTYYKLNDLKEPKVIFGRSPYECQKQINKYFAAQNGTKEKTNEYVFTYFLGSFDMYWVALYKYIIEVLKCEIDPILVQKLNVFEELSKSICFWYPYEDVCFVSHAPATLIVDEQGRLHSNTEAAMSFLDGYSLYSIHGVTVPEYVVKTPNLITKEKIDQEANIEVRRVMLDIFGTERYLLESKFEVLDEDVDQFGRPRRLLRTTNGEDEPIVKVEVTNSSPELDKSYRKYYISVHPELKPILSIPDNATEAQIDEINEKMEQQEGQQMTCHNAVASTFGKRGEDYGKNGQFRQGDVLIEMKTGNSIQKPFQES